MSGMFGIWEKGTEKCLDGNFYGTDYHSHLGTKRAGLAYLLSNGGFERKIHDISGGEQFRDQFRPDLEKLRKLIAKDRLTTHFGIGIISDRDSQPLIYDTKLGCFAIVTVGRVTNLYKLAAELKQIAGFTQVSGKKISIAEVAQRLICSKKSVKEGIEHLWSKIEGSLSLLLLFSDGRLIAARDRYGVSPVTMGTKAGGCAFATERSSLFNLGFRNYYHLKPGEILQVDARGQQRVLRRGCQGNCRFCTFFFTYLGFPASAYEGLAVEPARNRCGAAIARRDSVEADLVGGIPDSGTGHAIGYANESKILYGRPFTKYTPTWPRSYMPEDKWLRHIIARMKLIPVEEMIKGQRLLICDDSIVRGTQLGDLLRITFRKLKAREVHIRPACPPPLFPCLYLRSTREVDELAARRAIKVIEGRHLRNIDAYLDPDSRKFARMVEQVRRFIGATTLMYLRLDDMIDAIGLPESQLCTYCWTGKRIDIDA